MKFSSSNFSIRVGIGYDCHKFLKGRKLYLGGVNIKFYKGLKGHSDADVVIHSICDALLSALGSKDIGELFPDTNKEYKNISSRFIAEKVLGELKKNRYKIVNIDIVIICDQPKITQYKQEILNSLKEIFQTKFINIKGKTTEGIECFKEHIQCYSVVMIKKYENT